MVDMGIHCYWNTLLHHQHNTCIEEIQNVEKDMNELGAVGVGLYWKPVKFGAKALKTVALIAYACPECGYVEQYIKNLEQDREKLD